MQLTQSVLNLPRLVKRLLALGTDVCLCLVTVWIAYYLRTGVFHMLHSGVITAMAVSVALAIPIFITCGLYRAVFRFEGLTATVSVVLAVASYGLIYMVIFTVFGVEKVPRTLGLIQPALLLVGVLLSRGAVRLFLSGQYRSLLRETNREKVMIYGAGESGRLLFNSLEAGRSMKVVAFIDDDKRLQGGRIANVKIHSAEHLPALMQKLGCRTVLLAIPHTKRSRLREIVDMLQALKLNVRTMPSVEELASGRVKVDTLRELEIDELLGRDPVAPREDLIGRTIAGKTVLVTGAGGSIGSELCRQIVKVGPQRLLLVERSEFMLYKIYHELIENTAHSADVELVPLLADVTDAVRMREIMSVWLPETVYHAAAYKHVPMVEHNPLEGIENNVFGTLETARAAREFGVRDFVLISTDKAVRPTNVMGTTKRFAELILQAMAAESHGSTVFTMVRFGNVLGSSGSVVPRFREQIRAGGPVTLTHPDIVRYFMTIPEASQLVIQAAALGEGGDVFVLDMGKPVKIYDLARRMIELSGLTVRSAENPAGDIEIAVTGLRPGEKLYEELLIGDNPEPTVHPRIFRAQEKRQSIDDMRLWLEELQRALNERDRAAAVGVLRQAVPEFMPKDGDEDWVSLYREALRHRDKASHSVFQTEGHA